MVQSKHSNRSEVPTGTHKDKRWILLLHIQNLGPVMRTSALWFAQAVPPLWPCHLEHTPYLMLVAFFSKCCIFMTSIKSWGCNLGFSYMYWPLRAFLQGMQPCHVFLASLTFFGICASLCDPITLAFFMPTNQDSVDDTKFCCQLEI